MCLCGLMPIQVRDQYQTDDCLQTPAHWVSQHSKRTAMLEFSNSLEYSVMMNFSRVIDFIRSNIRFLKKLPINFITNVVHLT